MGPGHEKLFPDSAETGRLFEFCVVRAADQTGAGFSDGVRIICVVLCHVYSPAGFVFCFFIS